MNTGPFNFFFFEKSPLNIGICEILVITALSTKHDIITKLSWMCRTGPEDTLVDNCSPQGQGLRA